MVRRCLREAALGRATAFAIDVVLLGSTAPFCEWDVRWQLSCRGAVLSGVVRERNCRSEGSLSFKDGGGGK